jgi:hypothetical protein
MIYLQFCRDLDAAGGPPRAEWSSLGSGSFIWTHALPIAGGTVGIIFSTENGSTVATFTDSVGGKMRSTTASRGGDFAHPTSGWHIDP